MQRDLGEKDDGDANVDIEVRSNARDMGPDRELADTSLNTAFNGSDVNTSPQS